MAKCDTYGSFFASGKQAYKIHRNERITATFYFLIINFKGTKFKTSWSNEN